MKKILSLVLIFCMLFPISVFAEGGFTIEEDFTFDIFDIEHIESDETVLMELEEDVKELLEERLIKAWENMESEVALYPDIKIHRDDITAYFSTIYFENPQYYYVARSFGGTVNSEGYMGKLTKLSYSVTDKTEIEAMWEKIDKAVDEIMLYISPDMTDFEKVMAVHDYMVLNYTYDIEDMDQTYSILLDKVGVCAAYSEAFQHVMNELGIEATLVKSDSMGHIWNLVKLDERWYHIDVTWDDPVPDQFGIVNHKHTLLSSKKIKELGHYGFDTGYYDAIFLGFDDAPWRDEYGSIVTVDGICYYSSGNNIVDENGKVIFEEIDGGDNRWSIGGGYVINNAVFAGLCEFNGLLYFNTDKEIYSYNPKTEALTVVLEKDGVSGIFMDKNILMYNTYDIETGNFIKSGEIKLGDVKLIKPYFEDGKMVVRLYNDCSNPLWVISRGTGWQMEKIEPEAIGKAEFENGTEQIIYIWTNSLEPICEPITVSE